MDDGGARRAISEEVAREIEHQVKQSLTQAYRWAKAILELNRELLESTTHILLSQEVLKGEQLQEILAQVQLPEK